MSPDILNNQPARPSTVLPGHWLLSLPANSAIHVRRYRVVQPASGEGGVLDKIDSLETAWRDINTTTSGQTNVKDILRGPCAVVCAKKDLAGVDDVQGRELWCFRAKPAGETWSAEDEIPGLSDEIEAISPDLPPIEPRQLLDCPRHGHDLSCLLRPSTSQRPLKSCDVRFDPQGVDKIVWDKLAQAVREKAEWNRGKRIVTRRDDPMRMQLFPTPGGLLLLVKSSAGTQDGRHNGRQSSSLVRLDPLGLPARVIGPYEPSALEAEKLVSSFELALGRDWKEGQAAARVQSHLELRAYHPYTVLWVPMHPPHNHDSVDGSSDQPPASGAQGVLTIWPTHLLSPIESMAKRIPRPHDPAIVLPPESHLDIMASASSLFDSMAAYQEPVPTPPADPPVDGDAPGTSPPDASQPGSPVRDPHQAPDADPDDDLEDLFVSNTPARSPEMFSGGGDQAFEMFGDRSDRRISVPDNSHLIDYGDVVMSSPPALERRDSSRDAIGKAESLVDEPEPAGVTEDDFNFFDSPVEEVPHPVQGSVIEQTRETDTAPPVPDLDASQHVGDVEAPAHAPDLDQEAIDIPTIVDRPESAPQEVSVEDSVTLDVLEETRREPASRSKPESLQVPSPPPSPQPSRIAPSTALPSRDVKSQSNNRDLVPDPFAPLELGKAKTVFAYSLPTPAATPPDLNADLIERIAPPKVTKQTYDYSSAWAVDAPPSELDEEDHTGPPTPMTDLDDIDVSTARATPAMQNSSANGMFLFDGVQCISTEWMAFSDDTDQLKHLCRPWAASWGTSLPAGSLLPSSDEKQVTKKRKRGNPARSSKIDLDALATQIICNRDLRQLLTRRQTSSLPMTNRSTDLGSAGVMLSDFQTETDAETINPADGETADLQGPTGTLQQCNIHAGFRDNVIRLSIASLRYWRELDLEPLSGPKDITALLIKHGDIAEASARSIVEHLVLAYASLGLGQITLAQQDATADISNMEPRHAAVAHATRWLAKQDHAAVAIIVCDSLQFASMGPYLDHSKTASLAPDQLLHFLPPAALHHRDPQYLARDLYDRIPRQLRPTDSTVDNPPWYHYPSFTLCPESPPKPHLTLQWPIKSFDIFGSWRWVHAAYGYCDVQRAVVVFVADAEGENWQVKVLRDGETASWSQRVDAIWRFLRTFAQAAAVEWRVSICRLSLMKESEIKAWRDIYVKESDPVSIMMSEPANLSDEVPKPRNGPPNVPLGIINDPSTTIIDESLSGSYHTLPTRQPVSIALNDHEDHDNATMTVFPESTTFLTLNTPALQHVTSTIHLLYHRPAPGKDDEVAEKALATELHRASCWSRVKFGLDALPGHLAQIDSVLHVLGKLQE